MATVCGLEIQSESPARDLYFYTEDWEIESWETTVCICGVPVTENLIRIWDISFVMQKITSYEKSVRCAYECHLQTLKNSFYPHFQIFFYHSAKTILTFQKCRTSLSL